MADFTVLAEVTKVNGASSIDWVTVANIASAIATAGAAIATGIAAWYTAKSVNLSRKMNEIAEKQLSLSASPNIVVDPNKMTKATDLSPGCISFTAKNVGKVTAMIKAKITDENGELIHNLPTLGLSLEPTQNREMNAYPKITSNVAYYLLEIEFWPKGIQEKKIVKNQKIKIDWSIDPPKRSIIEDYYPEV